MPGLARGVAGKSAAENSPARMLAFGVLAVGMWLATHPYVGIYHDAVLYSLIALEWLRPAAFANDVFFLFGSQGGFSAFTPVFGWLVGQWGLDAANRFLTLFGGALWIMSFALLGMRVFGYATAARLLLLAAAVMVLPYTPNGSTFAINENFATARIVAMPLTVMAIAIHVSGKRTAGWMIAALSAAFHPLIGGWGLAVLVSVGSTTKRLLALVAIGAALLLVNHLMPIGDWGGAMDSEWLALVRATSGDVLFDDGGRASHGRYLFWLAILLFAGRAGEERLRPYYCATAFVVALATLLALYCSYVHPVRILVQLQTWRALWLGLAVGLIACADIASKLAAIGFRGGLAAIFLVSVLLALGPAMWVVPLAGFAALCILQRFHPPGHAWKPIPFYMQSLVGRGGMLLAGVFIAIQLPTLWLDVVSAGLSIPGHFLEDFPVLRGALLGGGGGLGLLVLALVSRSRRAAWILVPIAAAVLIAAAASWDYRTNALKSHEEKYAALAGGGESVARLSTGAVIEWPGHETDVWFSLGAASYVSATQAIGSVFSRPKAIETRRRLERLATASLMNEGEAPEIALARYRAELLRNGQSLDNLYVYSARAITWPGAIYLCDDAALAGIVLPSGTPPGYVLPLASLRLRDVSGQEFVLLRCATILAGEH